MNNAVQAKRIVIKVGTSTLTYSTGLIHIRRLEALVRVLSDLANSGREIVLVTSGAIGVGCGKLGLRERPQDIPTKQAAAAVGQCELMNLYDTLFDARGHTVAQVLLERENLLGKHRVNTVNTLSRLLELRVIPIINENDTVAVDEIVIGDNDTLSAVVAELVAADCLVLLSDVDGLYTANPRTDPQARLVPRVEELDEAMLKSASGTDNRHGTGGMITKLQAAGIATGAGVGMYILNGERPEVLYDLFDGKEVGTYFVPKAAKGGKRDD